MRTARKRLVASAKGAIHRAVQDGLVSPQTAAKMIDTAQHHIDELARRIRGKKASDRPAQQTKGP
jgi:hypothetical protein